MKRLIFNISKIKVLTILVVFLLCINVGIVAGMLTITDWKEIELRRDRKHGPKQFIINQLQLTKEQQIVFESLKDEHFNEMIRIRKEIKASKSALYDLLKEMETDSIKYNQLMSDIIRCEARLEKITFMHFKKLRAICNPSQQQQFDIIIDKVMERMSHGPPPR